MSLMTWRVGTRMPKPVSRWRNPLAGVVLAIATASSACAETLDLGIVPKNVLDDFIIEQLRCVRDPDATRVFIALAVRGEIDLRQNDGMDGIACYSLTDDYTVDGLPVQRICGIERESLDWKLFPSLYDYVPGTFPPEVFEVYSNTPKPVLSDWLSERGLNAVIVETEFGSALICSPGQWMQSSGESLGD